MPGLPDVNFQLGAPQDEIAIQLLARVLEQQAQLADDEINRALLTELVDQFVHSELALSKAHAEALAVSRIDGLTGIANRRWFDECLAAEITRAKRSNQPIGLLLMDIDCFKLYNDHYGHVAGDRCLKTVANAVHEVVKRPPDLTARYGGEEIVCLLPDTDLNGVQTVGIIILEAIRSLHIEHRYTKAKCQFVTVSIGGISMVPSPSMESTQFIEAVDTHLYHSKENGRNRLTI